VWFGCYGSCEGCTGNQWVLSKGCGVCAGGVNRSEQSGILLGLQQLLGVNSYYQCG